MSKSVLISIQPKWCELIASGKKTIEIRKTKPRLETPFKVYIYCTQKGDNVFIVSDKAHKFNGKVIGEFVCDEINSGFLISPWGDFIQKQTCLTYEEIQDYGKDKPLFYWHISNLVIYDKPRELSEFKKHNRTCYYDHLGLATPKCKECKDCQLTRPPQSWCYVESEVQGE